MRAISKLQFITTNADTAELACKGGVDWVQLRLKNISYDEYRNEALKVQAVCKKYDATFIVNDSIQLALEINADGVHVGKEDPLPQHHIDEMLGRDGIIGCSTNTTEDIFHFRGKPVSYLGLGPYRHTTTKQNLNPVLGINGYRKIFAELREDGMKLPPIIGIGGITVDDVSVLMSTGLHGIAVSGAIGGAPDITQAAREFKSFVDPSDKQVNKTTMIDAPVSEVWHAITQPSVMKDWLSDTQVDVVSEWKEGSSIAFLGSLYGKPYKDKGMIILFQPEREFSYSYWGKLSSLPDLLENYSVIKFSLKPLNGQTELTLTHDNFKMDTAYRHWNYYWTLTIDRLKKIIEQK